MRPSLKLVQMVSYIVPSCRKDPSEPLKVQICEKGSNKLDYAADGILLGGNPECYKTEHRSSIALHKQRLFHRLAFCSWVTSFGLSL